jgi:hypothetical protein
MSIYVAQSSKMSVPAAVDEIRQKLGRSDGALLLFFASSSYEPVAISSAFQAAFPHTPTMGCSTSGEIVSGHLSKNSVVAMLIGPDLIEDVCIEVAEDLSAGHSLAAPVQAFERHFGRPVADLDFDHYVGLILVDGLSGAEERLMDELGNATDVAFVGGSAGDDLKFSATHVYANGQAHTNAAVLAVLKPKGPFSIIKTQSFTVLPQTLTATEVDQAHRLVLSFDGQPAVQAYSGALGVPAEAAASQFMVHPMGLVLDAEPFVRSPRAVQDDALAFYCNITEGMQLHLLQSTDIVADTRKAIEDRQAALGRFRGLINFHCILRTLELEQSGRVDDYARVFEDIPTIGFSTYGEQYLGHVNQTSTMLAFV